ncbi:MAG: hypothetical protein Q4C64_02320 [Erysipelotrichia bacterium]|nr:hypothetical protein [Erysipelotrichia bacterium]
MNIDYTFFIYVLVVALLMIANTIFRIALAQVVGDFSWNELWKGLKKYLLIITGVALVYVSGLLLPDMKLIAINQQDVTILDGLNILSVALVCIYAYKCFENIKAIFDIKNAEIEEKEDKLETTEGEG